MTKYKTLKTLNSGEVVKDTNCGDYHFLDDDGYSKAFSSKQEAIEGYYIKQAYSYYGSAIRDNSRDEKVAIGMKIDNGEWEEE